MRAKSLVTIVEGRPSFDTSKLRHDVTILYEGTASPPEYDAAGVKMSWLTFTTARAAIETIRGTDAQRFGQTTTQLLTTVTIWHQPGILPNMRVRTASGSEFVIQSIENVLEMDVALVLNCIALGSNT
jgi:hypothetical protein